MIQVRVDGGAFNLESWYLRVRHSSPRSSTSKMRVALGGIVQWSQGSFDVNGSSLVPRPPVQVSDTYMKRQKAG